MISALPNHSIVITLSLPPRALSKNRTVASKQGRLVVARAAKAYRLAAGGKSSELKRPLMPWTKAVAQLTFYFPNHLRRDERNYEFMMYPAYDGLVDAGVITDDRSEVLSHEPTIFDYDKVFPRVELKVTHIGAR